MEPLRTRALSRTTADAAFPVCDARHFPKMAGAFAGILAPGGVA
jgi:hypothetical protein